MIIAELRRVCLLLICICLTSCATTKPRSIPFLPAGSRIALVDGLDHDITYRYVGESIYLNNEIEYRTYQFTPGHSLLQPIKTALENSGYQVVIVPVHNPTLLRRIYLEDGDLTYAQNQYLLNLVKTQVDRVIIITKAKTKDFNNTEYNSFGYGYLQADGLINKTTSLFAAVHLRVITMSQPGCAALRKVWATENVDNSLFAAERSKVTSYSVTTLNRWLATKFANAVIDDMRNSHMIR